MNLDENTIIGKRRTLRLKGYDYSMPGAYFVTICVSQESTALCKIENNTVELNKLGVVAANAWELLESRYSYVMLDEYVIMPNHIHGIIIFLQEIQGGSRTAPTIKRKPLGRIIGAFKTMSTKRINEVRDVTGVQFWQRNYYEHVIRSEKTLERIRRYIQNNPANWAVDRENPSARTHESMEPWELDSRLNP